MIACYLIYSGFSPNAHHALRFFSVRRTRNAKGVTIPSQIRYVHYYDMLMQLRRQGKPSLMPPDRNPLILTTVSIHGIPKAVRAANVDVWFQISSKDGKFNSRGKIQPERRPAEDFMFWQGSGITGIAALDNDVLVKVYYGTMTGQASMFACWFNTRMLAVEHEGKTELEDEDGEPTTRLVMKKSQLDGAIKDKAHKLYGERMSLELIFHSV